MNNNKRKGLIAIAVVCLLIVLTGIGITITSFILQEDPGTDIDTTSMLLYLGIGLTTVGLIFALVCILVVVNGDGKSKKKVPSAERLPDVEANLDGSTVYKGETIEYVPNIETYEFVNMGKRQSVDEKFDQIGKMGKTQFVIYVAKLFSLKNYEVQLTPVIDNHEIDMLVKKDGVTKGVSCLLANKVLCQSDIESISEGLKFYQSDGVTIITNMYFDRTALNYAKENKITLVDRNILAEEFMN